MPTTNRKTGVCVVHDPSVVKDVQAILESPLAPLEIRFHFVPEGKILEAADLGDEANMLFVIRGKDSRELPAIMRALEGGRTVQLVVVSNDASLWAKLAHLHQEKKFTLVASVGGFGGDRVAKMFPGPGVGILSQIHDLEVLAGRNAGTILANSLSRNMR